MHRLICAFVVRIWQKQVFSWRGSYGPTMTAHTSLRFHAVSQEPSLFASQPGGSWTCWRGILLLLVISSSVCSSVCHAFWFMPYLSMHARVWKVHEKAKIRNDRIEFHILSQTPNGKGTNTQPRWHKIKTGRAESQGDSSFPADGHQAIQNKMNIEIGSRMGKQSESHNRQDPYWKKHIHSHPCIVLI